MTKANFEIINQARAFLLKNAIGENIFDNQLSYNIDGNDGFPFYNIYKTTEYSFMIELAVAGYKKSDIEITIENNYLSIKGTKRLTAVEQMIEDNSISDSWSPRMLPSCAHRGISNRDFKRMFKLSPHTNVTSALIHDGILTIHLEVKIPEISMPKTIPIE